MKMFLAPWLEDAAPGSPSLSQNPVSLLSTIITLATFYLDLDCSLHFLLACLSLQLDRELPEATGSVLLVSSDSSCTRQVLNKYL